MEAIWRGKFWKRKKEGFYFFFLRKIFCSWKKRVEGYIKEEKHIIYGGKVYCIMIGGIAGVDNGDSNRIHVSNYAVK